jgi:hypothetical protein
MRSKNYNCRKCSPVCIDWRKGTDTCRARLRDHNKHLYGLDQEQIPEYLVKQKEEQFKIAGRVGLKEEQEAWELKHGR